VTLCGFSPFRAEVNGNEKSDEETMSEKETRGKRDWVKGGLGDWVKLGMCRRWNL
jgi:hypothetical protein